MKWTPDEMDRLERAIVEGARIQLSRRGTEYVVVPVEIRTRGTREVLVADTYTGVRLDFALDEMEGFDVIR